MTRFKSIVLSIYLLFPIFMLASEIKGTVYDEGGILSFANVFLTNQNGEIVAGAISDEKGEFIFDITEGDYELTVSFIGFVDYKKQLSVSGDVNLGKIVLERDQNTLNEIVVVSKKKLIERKVDRMVFNVENSIAASGGDALDALRVAPGLRISNDDISMVGKSEVRVMVDGRMLQLSGDELTNFLSSISSDDIKKIEVITNPPAKYEASGNGGIVNIVYKKGRRNSWNNATTISHTQSVFGFTSLRNTFSYNKKKVKALLNLSGRIGDMEVIETADLFYPDESWKTLIHRKDKQDFFSGRLELDYDISDNTTIGVQYLQSDAMPDIDDQPVTSIFDLNNNLTSKLETRGVSDRDDKNKSFNTHMITSLDTLGRKLSIDLDYFNYRSNTDRTVITEEFTNQDVSLGTNFSARTLADQEVDNYSAKIDMEHPIKNYNLSYGAKISYVENQYSTTFFNTISGTEVIDPNQTNVFAYEENIQAAYANLSKKIGEKWEVQAGLRLENTQTKGISNTVVKNDYINFFPTFYLSYLKNDNHSFSFNYGRRINRPFFEFLNPFRWYLYSNFYTAGNPFLQPSFNDNFELSHSFKKSLVTTLGFYYESDGFFNVADVDSNENIFIFRRENFFKKYTYSLSESYVFNEFDWWEANLFANLYYVEVDFDDIGIDLEAIQEKWSFYFSIQNSFILNKKKTLKAQVNYWYDSPFIRNFGEIGESSSLDVTLNYAIKNNLQITVGAYDLLKDSFPYSRKVTNGVGQVFTGYFSNRNVRVSLKYNFGNKNINVKSRKLGNSEERRRTGL